MKPLAAIVVLFPVALCAACIPVSGDRILGRDLASADAAFTALPPSLPIAYTPLAGSPRVFQAAELHRLARANGISLPDAHDVCFEFPLHIPGETEFVEAMRRVLPEEASIRLLEMQHTPIPSGAVTFPLTGLEPLAAGNSGVQLWRGYVQYTETRRVPLSARVVITQPYAAVIAMRDLAAGTVIGADSIRVEARTGPLKRGSALTTLEAAVGRELRASVKAGSELDSTLLADAPVVRRGDPVHVEVQSGLAVLRFDGVAENSARAGEIAEVRCPLNGKIVRVRLGAGPNAVIVVGRTPVL